MRSDFWTDEAKVERLKVLWDEGLTCSQIARALGGGLTRSAVIGKAHRLGLGRSNSAKAKPESHRYPAERAQPKVAAVRRSAKTIGIARAAHPEPVRLESGAHIGTADLKDNHCRWPHGDVGAADFHYCGHAKVAHSSWCEFHQVRVSEKSQPPSPEAGSLGRDKQALGQKANAMLARMFG